MINWNHNYARSKVCSKSYLKTRGVTGNSCLQIELDIVAWRTWSCFRLRVLAESHSALLCWRCQDFNEWIKTPIERVTAEKTYSRVLFLSHERIVRLFFSSRCLPVKNNDLNIFFTFHSQPVFLSTLYANEKIIVL